MAIIKVGHRGASGYEPENTLRAFKKAVSVGADMIELDVRVCKSGELVIMHDDKLNRTTNGRGKVENKTLEELKGLKMAKNQRIPTLEEVLDLIEGKIKINIELKGKNTAMPVRAVIEERVEKDGWDYDDFLISSFHHKELRKFKRMSPEIRIGVLTEMIPPRLLSFAKRIKAYSVNAPEDKIDEKFVKKAHKKGLKVFVYAANESHEIDRAKKLKVDYICSNFPDKIHPIK